MSKLALTALLVPDYDEAIAFLCNGLGMRLIEDSDQGGGKRWIVIGGETGGNLLVARAVNGQQRAAIGNQFGGRVGLFAYTDDFSSRAVTLEMAGAVFEESPREESYGKVAVFRDPWGNRWDLIQPV